LITIWQRDNWHIKILEEWCPVQWSISPRDYDRSTWLQKIKTVDKKYWRFYTGLNQDETFRPEKQLIIKH